jgi:AcrR family transcriptional regulator
MKQAVESKSTRDAILDATDRLLARYGYKKMTIDDLAREVGIGKGSVYLHFRSKEEIALSHIDRIIERLKQRLAVIAAREIPARKRVQQMLLERVLFRFDSVQHYTQNLNDMLGHIRAKLLERRERYFRDETKLLAAVISEGQKAGEFVKGNPERIANTFLLATNSLLPFGLSTSELGNRVEIEQATERIADALLNGIVDRSDGN